MFENRENREYIECSWPHATHMVFYIQDAVQEVDDTQTERSKKLENIIITDVSQTDLIFSAQKVESGKQ